MRLEDPSSLDSLESRFSIDSISPDYPPGLFRAFDRIGAGPPISTEISGEDAFVDLADVSVFRIDHLRAACFRDLAKQHVSFGGRNLPVILHPIDHFLEGNAHGVFQRTGAT